MFPSEIIQWEKVQSEKKLSKIYGCSHLIRTCLVMADHCLLADIPMVKKNMEDFLGYISDFILMTICDKDYVVASWKKKFTFFLSNF